MPISRRDLISVMSSSTFFLTAGPLLASNSRPGPPVIPVAFPQGVASGDPQPDAVMLWTRAEPVGTAEGPVSLLLQVSTNDTFSDLVLESVVKAGPESDYTLRAYVNGLAPDQWYYYRFLGGDNSTSITGRTRTAPASDQERPVNLAFASCQSYEQAHYGAWARMIADDLEASDEDAVQFVLHLGDFIYERCWHKRIDGTEQTRKVPPFPDGTNAEENRWAVSLADYRHLYKTYIADPDLQAARARWPFVCTWDDHEFSNDNYQSYSTYGSTRVLEAQRKRDANQAWFEFIPTVLDELRDQDAHGFRDAELGRGADADNIAARDTLRIYRQLRWGQYVDIVLTDTRSYRSAPPLEDGFSASLGLPLDPVTLVEIADAGRAYNNGEPPATLPYGDGTVPNPAVDRDPGTLLGDEQRQWFLDTLSASDAPWKLWGNALPIIPMRLDMSRLPFTGYEDAIFNTDAWAGYPHEQRLLMTHLENNGVTGVVSLSGDHHMHGAGSINRSASEPDAPGVIVDFTVAGIASSPLFGDLYETARVDHPDFGTLVYRATDAGIEPVWNMTLLQGVLSSFTYNSTGFKGLADWLGPNAANPGLAHVDTTSNGYGLASFDAGECRVQFVSLEDCRAASDTPPAVYYRTHFTLPLWQAGQSPVLAAPEFDGPPPFPFGPATV